MADLDKIIDKVLWGDIRSVADQIPDNVVQTIITSPPYFGHRNYGTEPESEYEIGRENSLDVYIENLTSCFSTIKSKLRDDGLFRKTEWYTRKG
ncbi:hypothetical protein PMG71_20610 [Roseofilum sp. BLCC_M154]|uniref:site-specific DNA-methyltransferase (cytosine-N(4)-specific) n=1 Tax=Roseofilum acuticapitatum BLCC-M154 TaxID=3022444 RepID=A0ABT7AY56_9CYAN|nr:hypothetical protein [Roseofilum acuticapitatum]MDJ1171834.1 hypothetical protein [Roseofilum acuticapitatum BLCC-M154]